MSEFAGKTIKEIRPMRGAELDAEGWDRLGEIPTVIVLNDGTRLYASSDVEGNAPGVLFGQMPDGGSFYL